MGLSDAVRELGDSVTTAVATVEEQATRIAALERELAAARNKGDNDSALLQQCHAMVADLCRLAGAEPSAPPDLWTLHAGILALTARAAGEREAGRREGYRAVRVAVVQEGADA
jgi:hypothetical protein